MNECYFHSMAGDFNTIDDSSILKALKQGTKDFYNQEADESQIRAWRDEIKVLRSVTDNLPPNWGIVMEYILPREEGRRPDVVILTGSDVLVLEFKQYGEMHLSHLDQVLGYRNDLRDYQSYCADKKVHAFLVLTSSSGYCQTVKDVETVSPDKLAESLKPFLNSESADVQAFLDGDYQPLPTILSSAKLFFNNEPLPQIRTAKSLKIDETIAFMQKRADEALAEHKNLMMLVTGVPGAGKTLVGLQFTFDNCRDNVQHAVMLSGNGPLVEVLRYVLKRRNFVGDVHGFMKTYGGDSYRKAPESIIIYDEAQRAWDRQMAQEKRGASAKTEPEDLMHIAANKGDGVVIVCLVGEGQEINRGEESGISQWYDAVRDSGLEWTICCPAHIADNFPGAEVSDMLSLSSSMRSKTALCLPQWVDAVLSGDSKAARKIADGNDLFAGFPVYISRSFRAAKGYLLQRYDGENSKRYGIIASSKAKNLNAYGIPNDFQSTKVMKIGPWFADDPESPYSCCQLTRCATEFSCQGLELDFPLVAWGTDFKMTDGKWENCSSGRNLRDPYQIRLNSYRVLLTRGREGMFIFVPDETELNETYQFLLNCGCRTGKDGN